ncbi:hypothetical protein LI82_06765 [Methanococcoides methylutens]|uniref:DUF1673 domain-containing protein n=1 Tax=Methanococcoides methylutens TaxID=2226 RepID=A0A099T316_METMT|nr:DUF1673 family protein [Methanococcoides methylutens]KGK98568.1 hypothetical protein LI82_06765 [Methanococcoides methylutens]
MTINVAETIRKVMGWCPNTPSMKLRSNQDLDFVNTSLEPSRRSNIELVQSENVMFPANTSLFFIIVVSVLNAVLFLVRGESSTILIPTIVAMYFIYYFLVTKFLQSNVLIDESGIHLQSFELKHITLKYNEIRSVRANKRIRSTVLIILLLAIPLSALVSLAVYSATIRGEWQMIISIASLVPGYLLVKHKLNGKYHDIDTQLSIKYENKNRYTRWYELTSDYSIMTDEMTASKIQNAIEHYRRTQ